jgi:hypothetical protein
MKTAAAGLLALIVAIASTAPLGAHDRYRIVGTVSKITATQIDVKQIKDNYLVEIDIDQQTKITRDKKNVALAQIKVGGSVVVEALGDSILDLTALEIRLVPPIPAAKPR